MLLELVRVEEVEAREQEVVVGPKMSTAGIMVSTIGVLENSAER
jgi:hypothetical protein